MTRYRRTQQQIEAGEGAEFFSVNLRFSKARSMANVRHIPWEITIDEYRAIVGKPCIYGGGTFEDGIRVSLDRLDNAKGYTLENVIPACWFHNFQRSSNWDHAAFLDIMAHYPTECRNRMTKQDKWNDPFKATEE